MVSDDVVSGVWRQFGDVIVFNKVFIRSYVGNQVAAIRHESNTHYSDRVCAVEVAFDR